jgi:alkylation response protein AidB-like acyl-CoA dehydrogenase
LEFAFDEQRECLAAAVTAAIGSPTPAGTPQAASQPFDRRRWDAFCAGPGAATMAGVSKEAIGSAASIAAILEALGHAGGLDTAGLAFGCQLAGVLHPLARGRSATLRDGWLGPLVAGEVYGAPVVRARPGEGLTATHSDGGLVVSGTAIVASFGLKPDVLVVPVSMGEDGAGRAALLLLLAGQAPDLDWQPATRDFLAPDTVALSGFAVTQDRVLSSGESGGEGVAHAQAAFCLGIQAMRIGLLRRLGDVVMEAARTATRRMKLTGRPPARFQALTHPIADYIVRCDAARLLVHEGARRLDAGERVPLEALLASFNMDTALFPYAADMVGLQRHWGLAENADWGRLLAAATALGRYAWSPVELSERVCASLRDRPRSW